ncbi:MAG: hypothetical protein IID55_11770 [Proteobacteria bacterium]|nr:hypothetical protein [Pseudomonadota bacterium]
MPSKVYRLGAAGLFLGLSACGIFPGDTNFAALDVDSGEIYTGALNTMFGEPTGALELSGLLKHVTCEGVTGNGNEGSVSRGTEAAQTTLIVRCDDGRIIRGSLHYVNQTTGFGGGQDTRGAPYLFLFGYSNRDEAALRADFAALASGRPGTPIRGEVTRNKKDTPPPAPAGTPSAETKAASLDIFLFEDDDDIDRAPE